MQINNLFKKNNTESLIHNQKSNNIYHLSNSILSYFFSTLFFLKQNNSFIQINQNKLILQISWLVYCVIPFDCIHKILYIDHHSEIKPIFGVFYKNHEMSIITNNNNTIRILFNNIIYLDFASMKFPLKSLVISIQNHSDFVEYMNNILFNTII